MFVRIIRGQHDSIHECDNVRISPVADKPNRFMLALERVGSPYPDQLHEIDQTVPEAVGVYVMNQNGKTIETVFQKADETNR